MSSFTSADGQLGSPVAAMKALLDRQAGLAGAPLQKLSSFEKMEEQLATAQSKQQRDQEQVDASACRIGAWYRTIKKMRSVRASLQPVPPLLLSLLLLPNPQAEKSFDELQQSLGETAPLISTFLASFPLDPQLRGKNAQARSARTLICAVLIALHPSEILQADGVVDNSSEAFSCHASARLLLSCLRRLVGKPLTSDHAFHKNLVGYRFAVRHYLVQLEVWKALDAERVARSLEVPYCQAFQVLLAARHAALHCSPEEREDCEKICAQTELHHNKIRAMFARVRGPSAEARLEELNALVESRSPKHLLDMLEAAERQDRREPATSTQTTFSSLPAEVSALAKATREKRESVEGGQLRDAELRLLERLSTIAGIGNERLAYELCADPRYRLPSAAEPEAVQFPYDLGSSSAISPTGASAGELPSPLILRAQMLRLISDRLAWSLLVSPFRVDSPECLSPGAIGPFLAFPPGASPTASPSRGPHQQQQQQQHQILSGRVLSIYEENGERFVDVEFLCDGAVEKRVPVNAPPVGVLTPAGTSPPLPAAPISARAVYLVKWEDGAPADPIPTLASLEDVCGRIGGLTPKRPELLQQLLTSLDLPFLAQMLASRSLGSEELSVVAAKLFFALEQLQSQGRLEEPRRKDWVKMYLSAVRAAQSFERRVLLLPALFEFVTASVEQISRDMANYYVSGLVPVMRDMGASFLCGKLLQRVESGKSRLDVVAGCMLQHLKPTSLNSCLSELAEAGVADAQTLLAKFSSRESEGIPHTAVLTETPESIEACGPRGWFTSGLVASILTSLLQLPVRLDSRAGAPYLPETLFWDATRLASLRDGVDVLVVMASLSVTARQQLMQVSAGLPVDKRQAALRGADEEALLSRLQILLREPDCSLSNLTTEAQRHVREALSPYADSGGGGVAGGLAQGWEASVEDSVKAAVTEKSAVLRLFTRRVAKVLLAACLRQPWRPRLKAMSLQSKTLEAGLVKAAERISVLHACTLGVYGDVYASVLFSPSLKEALVLG